MALIVEDGTGKIDAESYCDAAFADDFHSKRGNTAWTDLETLDKEIHLRRATDYMMQAYRSRWRGNRLKETQLLDWPREMDIVPDSSVIPIEVKRACAELALRSIAGDLAPDVDRETASETVGSVAVTYRRGPTYKRFRAIDMLLSPYLSSTGTVARLLR